MEETYQTNKAASNGSRTQGCMVRLPSLCAMIGWHVPDFVLVTLTTSTIQLFFELALPLNIYNAWHADLTSAAKFFTTGEKRLKKWKMKWYEIVF